ncbi:MAG: sulfatase-like hydrolase/transferase, partial [Planctomycetota bacterium]|jgi:hypothetical protein
MITRADADFGAIVDRIEALGLAEDTIFIVTSDNGATWDIGGFDPDFFRSNRELRGHKTQLYEGGLRVPFIATWRGRIEAGSECDLPIVGYDLFPTILELAGAESGTDPSGISLVPAFEGEAPSARPPLYWEQPSGSASVAARFGNHKAIRRNIRTMEHPPIEIYDLAVDPNEATDLAPSRPDLVAEAEAIFAKRIPSREPRWNPTYEPPPPPEVEEEVDAAAPVEIPATALRWTGDGDSADPRDPANWEAAEGVDLDAAVAGTSPIESVLVVDLGPDGAVAWPTIDFAGDGGLVLRSGRIEGARAGLRGGFVEVRGGLLERQFLLRSRATVASGATLRLTGPHLPLNGSAVALDSGGVVELTGLDVDAARARVLPSVRRRDGAAQVVASDREHPVTVR